MEINVVVRKWLSCLLVVLIALQSVVAMADVHQSHQSGNQHLEFDHQHGSASLDGIQNDVVPDFSADTNSLTEGFHSLTDGEYDCHHCCHCHSIAQFCSANNSMLASARIAQCVSSYLINYYFTLYSPRLRPPIV